MPVREIRLSRDKIAMYSNCLQQLRDEGIDVDPPDEWQEALRVLKIGVGAPWENMIFNVHHGGVYYAIWVRLVALRSGVILSDYEIATAWDNQITPLNTSNRSQTHTLGAFVFEGREVLNARVEDNFRFHRRGQVLEGWLLMSGSVPIPAEYRDFAAVPFEIAFTDQFGHEDRSDGFSVIRKSRQDNTVGWRGTGLDGLDATQQPRVPSPSEESKRRYYQLVAQKSRSKRADR